MLTLSNVNKTLTSHIYWKWSIGTLEALFSQIVFYLQQITYFLAAAVEACAGVIIGLAAIQATIRALILFFGKLYSNKQTEVPQTENIRLRLGRWLALALEFELAADILRTAIAPSWSEIGQLAAIAAIRTALNYFLQQEIDRAAQRQGNAGLPPSPKQSVERQDNASIVR